MPNGHPDGDVREKQSAKRAMRWEILWLTGFILLLALSMYLAAGRLNWMRGWAFLATYIALAIVTTVYLWRTNPEIVIARSTFHRGGKRWDRLLIFPLVALFIAIFPVAAMDDGRFHWSEVPLRLTVVGYVLLLAGMAGSAWVMKVNKFAEPTVRIQTDRKQTVIDTGPYAVVRHPLYAFGILLCVGIPLALGSFWALVPTAAGIVAIVVRTALEDRTLHNELDGHKEYASRVRYRLLPGVW